MGATSEPSDQHIQFLPPLRRLPGSRIVSADPAKGKQACRVLTPEFVSACSPVVSFDGKRVVFSGKKDSNGPWEVWEMDADGANKRRIVHCSSDCLTPAYLSSIYTLDNLEPRDQVVFASAATGAANEHGQGQAWSLYTCELSGENLRRITFNLSSDFDPTVLSDGRILFTSQQQYGTRYYPTGLFSLLTVNTDGTDLLSFYGNHELPILKCSPTVGQNGWIYFVESDGSDPLGGGRIAAVNLRRNLKTHTVVADGPEGFYHSPSPLPGGKLIVSYKRKGGDETYGLYKLAPESGKIGEKVFGDPGWHSVEAQAVVSRPRPKGRSSVVNYQFDTADIFCLNCYLSDRPEMEGVGPGSLRWLRVIEGIPLRQGVPDVRFPEGQDLRRSHTSTYSATAFGPRRVLGEVPLSSDGSFYIRVPAATPISFQVLDENGMAVLTHRSWMWAMPKEARGCIGCHEDRELTPPNRLTESLKRQAFDLTLPPEERQTVDFRHDIAPLMKARCLRCHTREHPRLSLAEIEKPGLGKDAGPGFSPAYEVLVSPRASGTQGPAGRYIHPGSARESPLVWHLFGQRMEKGGGPSQDRGPRALMPPKAPLSASERKLFIEWIDLGAQWNNRPSPEDAAKDPFAAKATGKGK